MSRKSLDSEGLRRVHVDVGEGYDVHIGSGLLARSGAMLCEAFGKRRVAVICDDTVQRIYLQKVKSSLESAGFDVVSLAFAHGEEHKTIATFGEILEFLAVSRLTRSDLLVALGGGVTGDVAGFAAASYMRGMRCIQMPTTLLAAVDSSVGGKTAVDLEAGKNLAGAFFQPSAVICDTDCLDTLDASTMSEGMAEALKYGVLCDEGLFDLLPNATTGDRGRIIERCVDIKRGYVEADEHEAGARRFLNLGHTVGHAIECCSGYAVSHGQAVAIGMVVIARACENNGDAQPGTTSRIEDACTACGLPVSCDFNAEELATAALVDKKRDGEDITLVCIRNVGECFLKPIPVGELEAFIRLGGE